MIYYVIPAREGSKGLPGKNRKLFEYTANTVKGLACKYTIVTTDDKEIMLMAQKYGFNVLFRKQELANDTTSTKDVLLNLIDEFQLKEDDIIVMLYLTYPQRTWNDIQNALQYYDENRCLSLLCRKNAKSHPYLCLYEDGKQIVEHDLYRRQDYPAVFEISHFIFISEIWNIKNLNNNLYNEDTTFFQINDKIDVDTLEDFQRL